MDWVYLLLIAVAFAFSVLLVLGLEKLRGPK